MIHARKDYTQRIQDNGGLIPADEPVFLLRAQDKLAAPLVHQWATRLQTEGGDPALVKAAHAQAMRMSAWPVKKRPDAPAEQL